MPHHLHKRLREKRHCYKTKDICETNYYRSDFQSFSALTQNDTLRHSFTLHGTMPAHSLHSFIRSFYMSRATWRLGKLSAKKTSLAWSVVMFR